MPVIIMLDTGTHEICIKTNGSEIQLSEVKMPVIIKLDTGTHEICIKTNGSEIQLSEVKMPVIIKLGTDTHEICIKTTGSEIQLSKVKIRKLQGDSLQCELVLQKNEKHEICAMCHGQLISYEARTRLKPVPEL